MNTCECGKKLRGCQTKFCSRNCANRSVNRRHKDYECQQVRGLTRKVKLVEMKRGACELCNYNSNYAALQFHHKNPKLKSFGIDIRQCSNRSWKVLEAEAAKCQLLCANCHMEIEHPSLAIN